MLGNITVDIFPELFKVNRTTFSTLLLDNQERTTDSTLTYFFFTFDKNLITGVYFF